MSIIVNIQITILFNDYLPLKTTPKSDSILGCLNVLIISTSLRKSSSVSRLAHSFSTFIATIWNISDLSSATLSSPKI